MRTERRKRAACALFAGLLAVFSGCGLTQKAEEPCMNLEMEDGQVVRTGTEQRFYQVEDGQAGELTVSIERESGSLNIFVFQEGEERRYFYRGTDLPTAGFTVTLSEPGEYKVWVEAARFAGTYELGWNEWCPGEE